MDDIVNSVRFKFEKKPSLLIKSNFTKLVRINHPNNCADVDIKELAEKTSNLSLTEFNQIHFNMANTPGVTMEVKLQAEQSTRDPRSGPKLKRKSVLLPKNLFIGLFMHYAWKP